MGDTTGRFADHGRFHSTRFRPSQMDVSGQWIFNRRTVSGGYQPMLVLGRGTSGLTDPQIPYANNSAEEIQILSVGGMDVQPDDQREPISGDHGEIVYPAQYQPRTLTFSCRICAGNLARLREMTYFVKRSLIPLYGKSINGTTHYKSTPLNIVYVPGDQTGAISSLSGNVGVETNGYVADFAMMEERPKYDGFMREFMLTIRCPDPRFYDHPKAYRTSANRLSVAFNTVSFSWKYENKGNTYTPVEFWIGDYLGDGGSASWTMTTNIIIRAQDTLVQFAQLSGTSGQFYYGNSKETLFLANATVFTEASNEMAKMDARYTSLGWLRVEPGHRVDNQAGQGSGPFPIQYPLNGQGTITVGTPALSYYEVSSWI